MIIGFDEVGRGALAGPVTTGAVALDGEYPLLTYSFDKNEDTWKNKKFEEFRITKDSKQLKIKDRQKVCKIGQKVGLKNYVISADNNLIDEYGIGVCLSHMLLISIQALLNDKSQQVTVMVDGKIKLLPIMNETLTKKILNQNNLNSIKINLNFYADISENQDSLFKNLKINKIKIIRENKADDKYLSVAIASNLAKVQRDNYMMELSKKYPDFGWGKNVGYATKINRDHIKKDPNNPYLRKTWIH